MDNKLRHTLHLVITRKTKNRMKGTAILERVVKESPAKEVTLEKDPG